MGSGGRYGEHYGPGRSLSTRLKSSRIDLLDLSLRNAGFEVRTASSATDALSWLADNSVDLIIAAVELMASSGQFESDVSGAGLTLGLTRASIFLPRNAWGLFAKRMDCRVKPGNDGAMQYERDPL